MPFFPLSPYLYRSHGSYFYLVAVVSLAHKFANWLWIKDYLFQVLAGALFPHIHCLFHSHDIMIPVL